MNPIKRWLTALIKEEVERQVALKLSRLDNLREHINDSWNEADAYLTSFKARMAFSEERLSKREEDMQNFLLDIERAVSVKENIETVMQSQEHLARAYWDYAQGTLHKTHEYNPSADDWREEAIPFDISREAPFHPRRIRQGIGVGIKAVKFMEGNGWGRYDMILNGVVRSWFLKRKDGNEDGAILRYTLLFLRENDVFEIRQVEGEGALKCALLIIVAGNKMLFHGGPFS